MGDALNLFIVDMLQRVEALAKDPLTPLLSDAAVYARISDDPEGLELGVRRQIEDAIAKAVRDQYAPENIAVFQDNDVSASTASRKPRPDFERLLAYIIQGKVKRVYAYSNSRLTRRPMELEVLIIVCRQYGVQFFTCVSGDDDLSTADGRMVARYKAVADAAEAERISERTIRAHRQRRDRNVTSTAGPVPFGYMKDGQGGWVLHPVESVAVRDGADLLIKGGTKGDVIRLWESRGLKPSKAKQWSRVTVKKIYESPRIAGLLANNGVLAESTNVPGILSQSEWEAVKTTIAPKEEFSEGYWRRKNLLTGFLMCYSCGSRMWSQGIYYACLKSYGGCGSTYRKREWVDNLINGLMVARLKSLPVDRSEPVQTVDNSAEIARLEMVMEETKAAHKDGLLDSADAFPMLRELRDTITSLRKQETAAIKEAAAHVSPADALTLWESGTTETKRRILSVEVEHIVVFPVGRGYNKYKPVPADSIDVIWKA